MGDTNSDVVSMETESVECQFEHKSEAIPPLPAMVDLTPETKSDVESIISVNCSNSTMLNGDGALNSNMNGQHDGDKKGLPSCIPPKGKDGATLFKFFKPVTPGLKNTSVENLKKTPSENDGKTVLKSNNGGVNGSPYMSGNTSPDAVELLPNKKAPSPTPASSNDKVNSAHNLISQYNS